MNGRLAPSWCNGCIKMLNHATNVVRGGKVCRSTILPYSVAFCTQSTKTEFVSLPPFIEKTSGKTATPHASIKKKRQKANRINLRCQVVGVCFIFFSCVNAVVPVCVPACVCVCVTASYGGPADVREREAVPAHHEAARGEG